MTVCERRGLFVCMWSKFVSSFLKLLDIIQFEVKMWFHRKLMTNNESDDRSKFHGYLLKLTANGVFLSRI